MQSVALMLQRNPSLVLVLLVGLPSLTWAAAYGRRPSRARRLFAGVALALTLGITVVAVVEARGNGVAFWPALAVAGAITIAWLVLYFRRPARR